VAASLLAAGEGALAVVELRALRQASPQEMTAALFHYWLGLAYLLAFDWSGASHEFRAFLTAEVGGWRAGWAYLHLGRAYERAGLEDQASLAYRGCLAVEGAERSARKLAFDRMSRLAAALPIGYGQASVRPVDGRR
jgi:Flp pilus assembly protein TadD